MIDTLFYPIEYVLQVILEISYGITNNYGVSLILLSVIVSSALLPIYALADSWREKEKAHQKRMSVDIQPIKKHYHGVERYYSIRAAYKVYKYSPLFSLRTACGFLIQIPFFFAAYHFLSRYTALSGVHFGIIQDLGTPDGILYGINLLPFVMTIINVTAGFFYIKEWNKNELLQLCGLSLFFLIVLYNSPAGLVLYWTMNNCFSLVKYIYINRKSLRVRTSQSMAFITRAGASKEMVSIIMFLLFLGGYFLVHYALYVDRASISAQYSLYTALWLLYVCTVCMYFYYIASAGIKRMLHLDVMLSLLFFIPSLIGGIYLLQQLHSTSLIGSFGNSSVMVFQYAVTLNNVAQGVALLLLLSVLFSSYSLLRHNISIPIVSNISYTFKLFAIMLFFFVFIVICAVPFSLYITDPEDLGASVSVLVSSVLVVAVIVYAVLFLIGYGSFRVSTRVFHSITTMVIVLTVVSVLYGFILDLRIGVLRGQRFSNDDILLTEQMLANFFEIVALCVLVYIIYYHLSSIKRYLVIFLSIMVLFLGGTMIQKAVAYNNTIASNVDIDGATVLPSYHTHIASFSKEKNILYVILDAFSADFLEEILKRYPQLNVGLDGFTWYKNTVSISEQTYHSMNAMIAGYSYAPDNIGKFNRSMSENIYQARAYWSQKLPEYDISYIDGEWVDVERLNTLKNVTAVNTTYDYFPYYENNVPELHTMVQFWKNFKQILDIDKIIGISLFKIVPFHVKQRIYSTEGGIFESINDEADKEKFISAKYAYRYLRDFAFLNTMATTSTVSSPKPTFKMFWSSAHMPYFVEENCTSIASDILSGEHTDYYSPKYSYSHLKCLLETMITWIQWMKEVNIYDNTKIVIASDHGSSSFLSSNDKGDIYAKEGDIFALLMVKDFYERGNIKISQQLMSNADIPSILASGIPEHSFPELQQDPIMTNREEIALKHFVSESDYNLALTDFELKYAITVQGDVYDKEKWVFEYFDK